MKYNTESFKKFKRKILSKVNYKSFNLKKSQFINYIIFFFKRNIIIKKKIFIYLITFCFKTLASVMILYFFLNFNNILEELSDRIDILSQSTNLIDREHYDTIDKGIFTASKNDNNLVFLVYNNREYNLILRELFRLAKNNNYIYEYIQIGKKKYYKIIDIKQFIPLLRKLNDDIFDRTNNKKNFVAEFLEILYILPLNKGNLDNYNITLVNYSDGDEKNTINGPLQIAFSLLREGNKDNVEYDKFMYIHPINFLFKEIIRNQMDNCYIKSNNQLLNFLCNFKFTDNKQIEFFSNQLTKEDMDCYSNAFYRKEVVTSLQKIKIFGKFIYIFLFSFKTFPSFSIFYLLILLLIFLICHTILFNISNSIRVKSFDYTNKFTLISLLTQRKNFIMKNDNSKLLDKIDELNNVTIEFISSEIIFFIEFVFRFIEIILKFIIIYICVIKNSINDNILLLFSTKIYLSLSILIFLFCIFLLGKNFNKLIKLSVIENYLQNNMFLLLNDTINNFLIIKFFNSEKKELISMNNKKDKILIIRKEQNDIMENFNFITNVCAKLIQFGIYIIFMFFVMDKYKCIAKNAEETMELQKRDGLKFNLDNLINSNITQKNLLDVRNAYNEQVKNSPSMLKKNIKVLKQVEEKPIDANYLLQKNKIYELLDDFFSSISKKYHKNESQFIVKLDNLIKYGKDQYENNDLFSKIFLLLEKIKNQMAAKNFDSKYSNEFIELRDIFNKFKNTINNKDIKKVYDPFNIKVGSINKYINVFNLNQKEIFEFINNKNELDIKKLIVKIIVIISILESIDDKIFEIFEIIREINLELLSWIDSIKKADLALDTLNSEKLSRNINFKKLSIKTKKIFLLSDRVKNKNISNLLLKKRKDLKIELKNVSLVLRNKIILKDITLTINQGEKICILGGSGSGKSILLSVICNLFEATKGKVLYNNLEINNSEKEIYLNNIISPIFQNSFILNKTIIENLLLNRDFNLKNFNLNYEEKKILENTYCSNFIDILPNKMLFECGYSGNKLSGGQKQRLSIARALLKLNSKLVICDEGLSALDSIKRKNILSYILDRVEEKKQTFICIMHRLTLLDRMDKIILIKDGKIVEIGSFLELSKNTNSYFYKNFYNK